MSTIAASSTKGSFGHVLQTFAMSLVISFIGTLVGTQVPTSFMIPLMVLEVVMVIFAFIVRKTYPGYFFLTVFSFISGITLYPVISGYGSQIGASMTTGCILITAVMFAGLSIYAYNSKRDFSFLGGFLLASTIGLIGIGILAFFVDFGPSINLVWAGAGIVVFSGWVLYDIAQYKYGVKPEEVPTAALNLYLDFINLLLYILRFVAAIAGSSSKD